MNNKRVRICIVGGGFGGLYTALHLNRHPGVKSGRWQLFLIEPKEHFLFTPLLYEVITGELQRWEIAPSYRQLFHGTKINFINKKATEIKLESKGICLENGEVLVYDYLVLVVGNQNRTPAIPGLAQQALTFRTMEDVERLNIAIHALENREKLKFRVAIVGGGANGVELACKLADRIGDKGTIQLIESNGEILRHFPPGVRTAGYRSLLSRGVEISLNTSLEFVTADAITIIHEGERSVIPVDVIIQTVGTAPREIITNLNCSQTAAGKLMVQPSLQLLQYPEVFALGDIAAIDNSKKPLPATAQAAYQASSLVAKNIGLLIQNKPLKAYKYLHLGDMLTLGKKRAIISSYGINMTGRLADIIRRLAYILRLPTRAHQLKVLQHWFKNTLLKISRRLRWQYNQLMGNKSVSPYEENSR
ncbi:MAG: Demethylphylloquinone reductase NdbB [Chroococcopsis gigantea SAG 12.99]|jgi:NADH:ubiquinone reductase (non-electrogenic)|nr:Demethylphylloquinone reductase NdbB [Chroococcopsis gigantea SAG 12.99]